MPKFTVEAHTNVREDRTYFLHGYRQGDPLNRVGTFQVDAKDVHAAAEKIFEVGNIGTPDAGGKVWPHHSTRSLSVGDVLTLVDPRGTVTVLAVASSGWRTL